MFNNIISAFRNLRMRSQIIIFEFIILLFVIALAGAATYLEIKIFYYISTNSSETMINSLDIKQINQATKLVSNYVKQKHQRSIRVIEHMSSFLLQYQQIQSQIKKFKSLEACVSQEISVLNQQYSTPKFCYQFNGISDLVEIPYYNQNISLLYESVSLLAEYDLLFSIESPYFIQIVDTSDVKFDATYPIGLLVQGYDPQTRPWYINHIKGMKAHPNELYFYSEVYKLFIESYDYQFSITHSLFNSQKQFFGIAKTLLTVNDPSFEYVLYNIILINYAGQVLYNGMEMWQNLTDIFYIYNENITGFNQTDWEQIEKHAVSRLKKDDKTINYYSQILILYNKYHQQFVHVQSEKFEKENFTLIIFTNVSSINIMEKQFSEIEQSFTFWYQLAAAIIFSICSLTITINIIAINAICSPLTKLTNQVSLHVLQLGNNINQQLFKIFNKTIESMNLLKNLNNKFVNFQQLLLQSQTKKCQNCRLLEKMTFNKKESNINLKLIRNQILLIPEFKYVEQIKLEDIIKQSLFQGELLII